MYAVIKTGGKQYRITAGQKLKIEQIPADIGQEISLDQVLSVGEGEALQIGAPFVAGAVVKATVLAQGRHDKIKIFKMRPSQALPQNARPSSKLHRNPHRSDQRLSCC
jgi:large subunit ribosomal protein L21